MKPRFYIFITLSVLCLLAAFLLAAQQMARYQAGLGVFPPGSMIAGLPVGGLDAQAAGARVVQAYAMTPVELRYEGAAVQLDPRSSGQVLDLTAMLAPAQESMAPESFWSGYWSFLWNRRPPAVQADLACSVDEDRLRETLQASFQDRYGRLPTPARAIPSSASFQPGQPGDVPDLAAAQDKVSSALCSLTPRMVELGSTPVGAQPPTIDQLELSLEAMIQTSGFDGLIELYVQDLSGGEEIQLAYNQGHRIEPGVAFTAASTIKIPVMLSAYKQIEGELPAALRQKMAEMIDLSDNISTDAVMQTALDPNLAPIQVTQDARAIGLDNTFLAGFFFTGAPLLDRFDTPANQRGDLSTDPDIYNQTTATDMGRLLGSIYRCAESGSGPIIETFAGQVTQAECREMVEFLANNRKAVLVEAGIPEGTRLAHKYGWVTDFNDGLMHTASDAAIVFTPRGDFVLTAYLYHPVQLHWDPSQALVAHLAAVVYNYYNQLP